MSIVRMFGVAALLVVFCAPATSIAAGSRGHSPAAHSASGSGRVGYYHHRHARQYIPHKKKKPPIGF